MHVGASLAAPRPDNPMWMNHHDTNGQGSVYYN